MGQIADTIVDFDILDHETSIVYFPTIPEILRGANHILRERSKNEILAAAGNIDLMVEHFMEQIVRNYEAEKTRFISHAFENGNGYFQLEEHEWSEARIRYELENWSQLYPKTCNPFTPSVSLDEAKNKSLFDILCDGLETFDIYDDPEFMNPQIEEYFAVLTIFKIATTYNNIWAFKNKEKYWANFRGNGNYSVPFNNAGTLMVKAANSAIEATKAYSKAEEVRTWGIQENIISSSNDKFLKISLSENGKRAAAIRIKKDPKQAEKAEIKDCWMMWKNRPDSYEDNTAFARDMLDKYDYIKSVITITRWCTKWEKELNKK